MKQDEHFLQVAIVNYCKYKGIPIFAIPNGGHRYISVARKLKAEGVMSGVADLFVFCANDHHHGLFIEVKVGYNKQSDTQKEFEKKVLGFKYLYKVVYSLKEFIEIWDEYRINGISEKN